MRPTSVTAVTTGPRAINPEQNQTVSETAGTADLAVGLHDDLLLR